MHRGVPDATRPATTARLALRRGCGTTPIALTARRRGVQPTGRACDANRRSYPEGMALFAPHLAAVAQLLFVHTHHLVGAAGLHGIGRFFARRLLLHTLLRSGGWILVLIVVVVLLVATQISRRRR